MTGTPRILHEVAESHSCHSPRLVTVAVPPHNHFFGGKGDTRVVLDFPSKAIKTETRTDQLT